jgi:hypothetical protein
VQYASLLHPTAFVGVRAKVLIVFFVDSGVWFRPTGRIHTINYTKEIFKAFARSQLKQEANSKPIRNTVRG